MRTAALTLALLGLAACQSAPIKPPKVVEVVVTKIVSVPARLTKPCDLVAKKGNSVGEAIRLANARKASIAECNARLAEIGGLAK